MSQSTDAILFFGYCWDEEQDLELNDWANQIAKKRGIPDPWDSIPSQEINALETYVLRQQASEKWAEHNRDALDDYAKKIKAIEQEFGCEIGEHCHSDCAMPYIYVKESRMLASRGYPIGFDKLDFNEDWPSKLMAFTKELGIDTGTQDSKWWLVSYWN